MSCYYGSKISGSQQFFSTEMAICIGKQWKESKGYRAQESHACWFLSFSCHINFAGPKFVEIQRFWYHGNVTWWLFLSISFNWKKGFCFFLLALDIYTCAYYTTNKVHESYLQLPLLDLEFILESNINAVRNLLLWNPLAVQICHSLVLSSLTFCP